MVCMSVGKADTAELNIGARGSFLGSCEVIMSILDAAIALNRFGLGARPRELAAVATDPRGWLDAQLHEGQHPEPRMVGRPGSAAALAALAQRRELRDDESAKTAFQMGRRDTFVEEMSLRLATAATTQRPFRERFVRFWCNHFC